MGLNWLGEDNRFRKAKWSNGKNTLTGEYKYNRASNIFIILLDKRDTVSGDRKQINTRGQCEFNGYKLVRNNKNNQ